MGNEQNRTSSLGVDTPSRQSETIRIGDYSRLTVYHRFLCRDDTTLRYPELLQASGLPGELLGQEPIHNPPSLLCPRCQRLCFDGGLCKVVKCVCGLWLLRREDDRVDFRDLFEFCNLSDLGERRELQSLDIGVFCEGDADREVPRSYRVQLKDYFRRRLRVIGEGEYFQHDGRFFKVMSSHPLQGFASKQTRVTCVTWLQIRSLETVHLDAISPHEITEDVLNDIVRPHFRKAAGHVQERERVYMQGLECVAMRVHPADGVVGADTVISCGQTSLRRIERLSMAPYREDLPPEFLDLRRESLIAAVFEFYLLPHFQGRRRPMAQGEVVELHGLEFKAVSVQPTSGIVTEDTVLSFDGRLLSRSPGNLHLLLPLFNLGALPETGHPELSSMELALFRSRETRRLLTHMLALINQMERTRTRVTDPSVLALLPVHVLDNLSSSPDLQQCMVCLSEFVVGEETDATTSIMDKSESLFNYKRTPLTDRKQYSTLIDYGFSAMTVVQPKSWILTVALAHLTKLSLQMPLIATFRAKLRDLVLKVSPSDSSATATLIQLLEDFDNPGREAISVVERMNDEAFRQDIVNAYLCILRYANENHPLSGKSKEENLVNALKIYLMTFSRISQPAVMCFVSSSVFVTIYEEQDFFGVLEHYKEANFGEDDFTYFPFVHDFVSLKEETKTAVMADMIQEISVILQNSDPKPILNSPETLKVEAVQKAISVLEQKCDALKTKELDLQTVYASVLPKQCSKCTRYDKRKQTFEVLSCGIHCLCRECRSEGPIRCPFCPPEILYNEDSELLPDHRSSHSVSNLLNMASAQNPQTPECIVCESSSDLVSIGRCEVLCTDCWRKYLNTFVYFDLTIECLVCDESHPTSSLLQKFNIETGYCKNCKMWTNSASLYPIPFSRTKCRLCIVCYLLMFKFHPDERRAKMLLDQERPKCLACKSVHPTSNGQDCCTGAMPNEPLRQLQCGHKVHTRCFKKGECPACVRMNSAPS